MYDTLLIVYVKSYENLRLQVGDVSLLESWNWYGIGIENFVKSTNKYFRKY
jgi:hypothetical protein